MKKLNLGKMTRTAILAAILILMAFTPLGYLHIGPFSMTLLMIPVAVGAIVLGPGVGLFLGTVFGLTSMVQCFGMDPFGTALMTANPIGMIITTLVTRALMGWLCGLIFKAFDRPEKPVLRTAGTFVASLSSAILNTILFLSMLVAFFLHNPAFIEAFGIQEFGFGAVITTLLVGLGLQALLEALIASAVGGAVSTALFRFDKGARK